MDEGPIKDGWTEGRRLSEYVTYTIGISGKFFERKQERKKEKNSPSVWRESTVELKQTIITKISGFIQNSIQAQCKIFPSPKST